MSQFIRRALCLLFALALLCGATASGARAGGALRATGSNNDNWRSKVRLMDWADGSGLLKNGEYGYIYDIDTGIIVHIKRMGGVNHADCEPAGKSDTAKLKRIAGGDFSWESHAVILYAGGKFVACAINTKPHNDQTIANNGFDGHFCLHMAGSRTTDSGEVNEAHQRQIMRAYRWARG